MSNTTKPDTSKKSNKKRNKKNKTSKRFVSTSHISLPGKRTLKMNITRWIMLFTLLFLLILVLVTSPDRHIRNQIKSFESKDDIVQYCTDKNLNCTFTTLSDYDIKGFKVSRVSFLSKDFFDTASDESVSEKAESKNVKNVYITIQKGEKVEVPK